MRQMPLSRSAFLSFLLSWTVLTASLLPAFASPVAGLTVTVGPVAVTVPVGSVVQITATVTGTKSSAAREYELTGEKRYHDIAAFFWERVAKYRSYVIGGHSDNEDFFPPEKFSQHLGASSTETCNTYNLLKLSRKLFAWEPTAGTMDFYERGLYNHILASQDPSTGMMCYYVPLKPGAFKTYSKPEDSFWCCVGTGMENHAKYRRH